jgi:hypothetical protein
MFGLPILEVAIGLSFVYLLLALICTALNETIAGITKRRADFLEKGINSLLGRDPDLEKKLFEHPLIASLAPRKGAKPSYLPASNFALALMDVLTGRGKEADDAGALRDGIKNIKAASLQTSLSAVLADSKQPLATNQQKIEAWYDDSMDRVSGWYKRRTVLWIWFLAVVVTVALNADSTQISRKLWINQAVRSAVVESARSRAQRERPEALLPLAVHNEANAPKKATAVLPHDNDVLTKEERSELSQLTGWSDDIKQWSRKRGWSLTWYTLSHIVGWMLTIVAVSLGAPFWFDTLNRFMNIRSAGRAPDESRDKSRSAQAPTQVVEVRR